MAHFKWLDGHKEHLAHFRGPHFRGPLHQNRFVTWIQKQFPFFPKQLRFYTWDSQLLRPGGKERSEQRESSYFTLHSEGSTLFKLSSRQKGRGAIIWFIKRTLRTCCASFKEKDEARTRLDSINESCCAKIHRCQSNVKQLWSQGKSGLALIHATQAFARRKGYKILSVWCNIV